MGVVDLEPRAKKILLEAHWTPRGWRDRGEREVPAADVAHARRMRMMFPRESLAHDALVKHIRAAHAALKPREVTDAFLASLSTRRLDLRSGLASYAQASHLRTHRFRPDVNGVFCAHCLGVKHNKDLDLNVLNFERHKWSGVRHAWPTYQYLDLRELSHALPATPEPGDLAIWANILKAVDKTPKTDGPGALEKRLADLLPSSKQERKQLLEILASAGVLVPKQERSSPGEWQWVGMWRGADGYDRARATVLFGAAMAGRSKKNALAATRSTSRSQRTT